MRNQNYNIRSSQTNLFNELDVPIVRALVNRRQHPAFAVTNFFAIVKLAEVELDTPTIALAVPMENERRFSFSVTNEIKAHLHQTKQPNAFGLRHATIRQVPAS